MSSPIPVDSSGEISFRPNHEPVAFEDCYETVDAVSECGSTGMIDNAVNTSRSADEAGIQEQMSSIAGILRDVVEQLQSIKNTSQQIPTPREMQTVNTSSNNNRSNRQFTPVTENTEAGSGDQPHKNSNNNEYRTDHQGHQVENHRPIEIDHQGQGTVEYHTLINTNSRGQHARQYHSSLEIGRQNMSNDYFQSQSAPDVQRARYSEFEPGHCQTWGNPPDVQEPFGRQFYRPQGIPQQPAQFAWQPAHFPRQPSLKLPSFSGKDEWATWIAQFEAIARRCQWSDSDKLDQLLPRLEGTAAQFVFTQLSPFVLNNYQDLITEMNNRFRVIETARSFAAKFSRRSQRPGETVEEYAADLKRLYDKAHRYRDRRTRDEDLVRRFLDGLYDEEVRFEVEFNKEPNNVDEAVSHAVNYVQIKGIGRAERRNRFQARRAYDFQGADRPNDRSEQRSERNKIIDRSGRKNANMGNKSVSTQGQTNQAEASNKLMQELITRLEKLEGKLEKAECDNSKKGRNKKEVECYNCHLVGHYARECPDRGKKFGEQVSSKDEKRDSGMREPLNGNGPTLVAK